MGATTGAVIIGNGTGADAAAYPDVPNSCIMIGNGCVPPPVVGRIAFGNQCEAVHGSFAVPNVNPQAYIKIQYNNI